MYSDALQRGEELTLAGSSDPQASGNGSLMRLAPVPVFYHNKPAEALAMSDLQSEITHSSKLCLESCRLATAQILGFFACPESLSTDERKKKVLDPEYVPEGVDPAKLSFETEEVRALRAGTWKTKSVREIRTTGFVIHSHEAALWALWNSSTFEEVCRWPRVIFPLLMTDVFSAPRECSYFCHWALMSTPFVRFSDSLLEHSTDLDPFLRSGSSLCSTRKTSWRKCWIHLLITPCRDHKTDDTLLLYA